MKIAISGSTGFLGSTLLSIALRNHPNLEVIPIQSKKSVKADQTTYDGWELTLLETFKPSLIIHTAAMANATICEARPDHAWRSNVEMTEELALFAASIDAHFIYTSTDLVFDGLEAAPRSGFSEESVPIPLSVYAKTKLEGENRALARAPRCSIVRLSLLYGPAFGERKGALGWMIKAMEKGESITLFHDEWRTPIYCPDAAKAILMLGEKSLYGLWHLGGPERLSRVEFGETLCEARGYSRELIIRRRRADVLSVPPRPKDVSLNSTKLLAAIDHPLLQTSAALLINSSS